MRIGILLVALFFANSSWAYLATIDTAELPELDHYRASLEGQFITDPDTGANLVGRFDGAIDDETGWRALIGAGSTDFQMAGFIKWVPIPDLEDQPGIGVLSGVLYSTDQGINEIAIRVHPLISKRFHIESGIITPYASLPFGFHSRNGERKIDDNDYQDKSFFALQLAVGSTYKSLSMENLGFGGEIGFGLSEAFTYISLYAIWSFDGEDGIQLF